MSGTIKSLEDETAKLMETTKTDKEQLNGEIKDKQAKLSSTIDTVSELKMKIIEITNESMGLINEKTALLQTISSKVRNDKYFTFFICPLE